MSSYAPESGSRPIYKPRPQGISRFGEPTAVLLLFALAVALPHIPQEGLNRYWLGVLTGILIHTISGMGFNFMVGWAGQLGLAHAGFFGMGAFGVTLLYEDGVPYVVALLILGFICSAVGIAIGFPAARLKGFFLAIATLAFGGLVVKLIELGPEIWDWLDTGASNGRSVKQVFSIGHRNGPMTIYYTSLVALVLTYVVMLILTRGRMGRTLRAVKDIEISTGPMGIPATRYKLVSFGVSAFAAAVAGGLYAQDIRFLDPKSFRDNMLVFMLIILVLGGVGRIWGPLLGAVFFILLREGLSDFQIGRQLIFGLALMIAILALPYGFASLPARIRESNLGKRIQKMLWKRIQKMPLMQVLRKPNTQDPS